MYDIYIINTQNTYNTCIFCIFVFLNYIVLYIFIYIDHDLSNKTGLSSIQICNYIIENVYNNSSIILIVCY